MDAIHFTVTLLATLVMGMAIGLERQFRQHPAGLRTNALVCVGAALFVSLSLLVQNESSPTRMASYVVSGIGFLGGGVILREGLNVRGMNTAATLWCTAAVGTLAGMGFIAQGAIGTVVILFLHLTLRPLVQRIDTYMKTAVDVETVYRIRVVCDTPEEKLLRTIFLRHVNSQPHLSLQGIAIQDTDREERKAVVAEIFSTERNDKWINELVSRLSIEPSVTTVSWEKTR